ncbi:hypothetical protein QTN25_001436 [Entamoeba marina]
MTSVSLLLDSGLFSNKFITLSSLHYHVLVDHSFILCQIDHSFTNSSNNVESAEFILKLHTRCSLINVKAKTNSKQFITKIKEKQKAREIYQERLKQEETAALVETVDKSTYNFKFGNIESKENINVTIEFISTLHYSENGLSFVIPKARIFNSNNQHIHFTGTFSDTNIIKFISFNDELVNNNELNNPFSINLNDVNIDNDVNTVIHLNTLHIHDNLRYENMHLLNFYDPLYITYPKLNVFIIIHDNSENLNTQFSPLFDVVPSQIKLQLLNLSYTSNEQDIYNLLTEIKFQQVSHVLFISTTEDNSFVEELSLSIQHHELQHISHLFLINTDLQKVPNSFQTYRCVDPNDLSYQTKQWLSSITTNQVKLNIENNTFNELLPKNLPKKLDDGITLVATSTTGSNLSLKIESNNNLVSLDARQQSWNVSNELKNYIKYLFPLYKIRSLSTKRQTKEVIDELTHLSLEYGILCKYTSFVIVEKPSYELNQNEVENIISSEELFADIDLRIESEDSTELRTEEEEKEQLVRNPQRKNVLKTGEHVKYSRESSYASSDESTSEFKSSKVEEADKISRMTEGVDGIPQIVEEVDDAQRQFGLLFQKQYAFYDYDDDFELQSMTLSSAPQREKKAASPMPLLCCYFSLCGGVTLFCCIVFIVIVAIVVAIILAVN